MTTVKIFHGRQGKARWTRKKVVEKEKVDNSKNKPGLTQKFVTNKYGVETHQGRGGNSQAVKKNSK